MTHYGSFYKAFRLVSYLYHLFNRHFIQKFLSNTLTTFTFFEQVHSSEIVFFWLSMVGPNTHANIFSTVRQNFLTKIIIRFFRSYRKTDSFRKANKENVRDTPSTIFSKKHYKLPRLSAIWFSVTFAGMLFLERIIIRQNRSYVILDKIIHLMFHCLQ